ncbi:MAG: oligoendopeptidase F [Desulfobacter sp.]|nr:MAG: oligoendopeptidase F [Desulfobacter sp.]
MSHPSNQSREQVAAKETWNLAPLFESQKEFETLYTDLESKICLYEKFKNSLGQSFDQFLAGIEFNHVMGRNLEKMYTYAHLKNDEDKTGSQGDELFQRAMNLYTRISHAASFIVPEIQAIDKATLEKWQKKKECADYQFYLEKIIRKIPHTRNAEAEELLAMAKESLGAPGRIFGQLNNADLNFKTLEDENGKSTPLTHGNFTRFLSHDSRSVRKKAFDQYYRVYDRHKHTIGSALAASIQKDLFLAKARHFNTARQAALFQDNVSDKVYDSLVASVKSNLSPLYNYLNFRKKTLGLDELHIYDTYVPILRNQAFHMGYDEAVATCIEALSPLGEEYCKILEQGLTQGRWVDKYENKGKRSRAYSSGCYDSPPYILLNYDEHSINSLFTLIHETGHSMHSYYANHAQPYPSHDYTIFVAEVASTLNETLLGQFFLKKYETDPRMNAYILNREIDNIRATFFRQTMFAEFEDIIHHMAAQNKALTLETLTSTYKQLLTRYFGDTMVIDDALALECLRIPHFYSSFYVYKYATGLAASLDIAQRIQKKGQEAVDDYMTFLKSGGSMFPIDQLKIAGVDMESPDPVNSAIDHFKTRVEQLEKQWPSI